MVTLKMNTDGAARGNPGPASIGIVLRDESDAIVDSIGETIGEATNNVAEYQAIIKGIEAALKHNATILHCTMDSELVCKQLLGEYKVKQPHLQELHKIVLQLASQLQHITYNHVLRNDPFQAQADQLANMALDGKI